MSDYRLGVNSSADLVVHVLYEHQHLAGLNRLSEDEIRTHYIRELSEYGTASVAVAAIRKRLGLPEIKYDD